MKAFLLCLFTILLTSCVPHYYYQVYTINPTKNMLTKETNIVYEDNNCAIFYNFWGEGGNTTFRFYNKTNENIYVHLDESFFIFNGIAYDYFQDRTYNYKQAFGMSVTKSGSKSESETEFFFLTGIGDASTAKKERTTSVETNVNEEYSTSISERKTICIPPKASKFLGEYKITEQIYRDCYLLRFPKKNEIRLKSFTLDNSPIVFINRISYSVGKTEKISCIENEFYISEISNLPKEIFFREKNYIYCGRKTDLIITESIYKAPNKFYNSYKYVNDGFDY